MTARPLKAPPNRIIASCPEVTGRDIPVAEPASSKWRTAVWLLVGLTVLQWVVGSRVPLDPDESYYWEWSRRLALGYYDHPPAIAYLIRAGTVIFGPTTFGVRFVPVLVNLGGGLIMLLIARRLGGARAGLEAALLVLSLPIVALWLLLATPDCPLFLANGLALYAAVRALEASPGSRPALGWWLGSGAALGLGLLSKLPAVILPFGILLALLSRSDLRRRLAEPGPYLACLLATLIVVPTTVGNPSAPSVFQLRHGFGVSRGSPLLQELDFIAGQAAFTGGILFVLLGIAVVRSLRRSAEPLRFVLGVAALSTLAIFAVSSLRHRVEANWPLAAYMPAVVLLASSPGGRRWRRWLRTGIALGSGTVALAYLQVVTPVLPFQEEMIRRGHGWDDVAHRVNLLRGSILPAKGRRIWLAGNTYQDASRLDFHLSDHPGVFALNLRSRQNQFSIWPGFPDLAHPGDDLVFILSNRGDSPGPISDLHPYFARIKMVDSTGASAERPEVPKRRIWLLEDWRGGWPGKQTGKARRTAEAF
jgi:dolichyl-phosphate-mannose-protein mannosyltransferase